MRARKIYIADGEKKDFPITEGIEIVEDPEIAEIIVFAQKRPLCYEYISDIDAQSKYKKYIEDSQDNISFDCVKDYNNFKLLQHALFDTDKQVICLNGGSISTMFQYFTLYNCRFGGIVDFSDTITPNMIFIKLTEGAYRKGNIILIYNDIINKDVATEILKGFVMKDNPYYRNLRYDSDITIYSAKEKTGKFETELERRPCFGRVIKDLMPSHFKETDKIDVEYNVVVKRPHGYSPNYGRCITFFNKEDYEKYYNRLQEIYPFEYSVKENIDETTLNIHINGERIYHLMILTMLRFIYQYPMHFILHDALKLWEMDEFKNMDILDIMNVVAYSLSDITYQTSEYMPVPYCCETNHKILSHFNKDAFIQRVNKYIRPSEYAYFNKIMNDFKVNTPRSMTFFTDEYMVLNWQMFTITFENRINLYKNNIEIFNREVR